MKKTGLKKRTSSDDNISADDPDPTPPFLPLEEQNENNNAAISDINAGASADTGDTAADEEYYSDDGDASAGSKHRSAPASGTKALHSLLSSSSSSSSKVRNLACQVPINGKKIVSFLMTTLIVFVMYDAMFREPEDRWLKPEMSQKLLEWVQRHPTRGWVLIVLVIAFAVVCMVPIGTPLTLGCGYIYKGAYGWRLGLTIATVVAMGGSALGAIICFLLGRYLMRDTVRTWIKKYPLFVAIDVAAAEHGLRIMAMLYLTPILPLGPVSYMCGTTSMALSHFVLAKIASLPLMLLYAFIGASMGALIGDPKAADEFKSIEDNEALIISGVVLSFLMITGITHYIKKELNKILERQQKVKPGELDSAHDGLEATEETALEMGMTRRRIQ